MSIKADLKQLLKPYYIFNIVVSLSYVILKRTPGVCNYLFDVEDCEFDGRESEILLFLVIVIMIKTRKSGSLSMISYLSSSFLYTKLANLILWFNADFLMGVIYGIIFILGALLFPEPTYSGPDNVVYFRGMQGLEDVLAKSKDCHWLVTFYTVWNPQCVNFAPIFASLSTEYGLGNFKFGKVDIGRYPDVAKKYYINDSSLSKQLPTVILFKDGREVLRRPTIDSKGKVVKFLVTSENVKAAFDLNNLFEQSKNNLKTKKKHVKSD